MQMSANSGISSKVQTKGVSGFWVILTIMTMACSTVPLSERKQVNLIPEKQLIAMSLNAYGDFLKDHPPVGPADKNSAMVKQVGSRIATSVINYMRQIKLADRIKGFSWEFNLVNSPEVNAWCMPGGKVVVYSGLLPVTKDETGLAFVMGHEIAHAVARHGNERMSQLLLAETGSIALDVALANKPDQTRALFGTAYGAGTQLGVLLPFSRLHETEADELGMIFMAMAGYDPRKAPEVWQRMIQIKTGPKPPEFLSTHPADNNRIEALKKFIPEALKYYKPRQ
jgi:predicted Zn-dependent protease